MKRPALNECPIPDQLGPALYITVSPGQWDVTLQSAYDAGVMLLEIDKINGQEQIVRAYQNQFAGEKSLSA